MYVYARGTDGYLWVNYWNGTKWQWTNQGRQILGAANSVIYDGSMYVYARGTDGYLWVNYWS